MACGGGGGGGSLWCQLRRRAESLLHCRGARAVTASRLLQRCRFPGSVCSRSRGACVWMRPTLHRRAHVDGGGPRAAPTREAPVSTTSTHGGTHRARLAGGVGVRRRCRGRRNPRPRSPTAVNGAGMDSRILVSLVDPGAGSSCARGSVALLVAAGVGPNKRYVFVTAVWDAPRTSAGRRALAVAKTAWGCVARSTCRSWRRSGNE